MSLLKKFKKSNNQKNEDDISLSSMKDFCSAHSKIEKCSYHTADVFLETDQISEEEKTFIRNCIYRQELLNLFDLEEFDQKKITKEIQLLYEEIKLDEDIQYILEKLEGNFCSPKEDCFFFLFSFDYLHITQLCLSDFFSTGKIEHEHLVSLLACIYEYNIDKI